jgi:hypothetical protein
MKTKTTKWIIFLLVFASFSIEGKTQSCQDTVYISAQSELINGKVHVHFIGYDFDKIASAQFTVVYDQEVLLFEELLDDADLNVGINSSTPGQLPLLFFSNNGLSLDVLNGSSLYTLVFTPLQNANSVIEISNNPLVIEIADLSGIVYCLETEATLAVVEGGKIEGHIWHDEDQNCNQNDGEQGVTDWIVLIEGDNYTASVDTDSAGYYSIIVPEGDYEVSSVMKNDLWLMCQQNHQIDNVTVQNTYSADFLIYGDIECPDLLTSVSAPFLRRCFENTYSLYYANEGTAIAEDAELSLVLDPNMSFVSTDFSDYTLDGQTLNFNLGDVGILESGQISVTVYLACEETVLGQTHCVIANISPNGPCYLDPQWSGALLEVDGVCEGDSVRFFINNNGVEDMLTPAEFIVVEDDVMIIENEILLPKGTSESIALEANGSTYRLSVEQVSLSPVASVYTFAIEGCVEEGETFSLGYVNMFEPGDDDNNIDIDCQENIGSYDPNDKAAFPKGYGSQKYIKANTDLEYKLRFQNTGTDTAFRVVIKDRLDPSLDMMSIIPGASSHDYEFSIEEDRTMVFTFDQINLVDSTTNEMGSHGFVIFKIKQLADLVDGTSIDNTADIYFDFNEAILTNTVQHTIGTGFVQVSVNTVDHSEVIDFSIYPNPATDWINLTLNRENPSATVLHIMQTDGKRVKQIELLNGNNRVSLTDLGVGNYFFIVSDGQKNLISGSLNKLSAY